MRDSCLLSPFDAGTCLLHMFQTGTQRLNISTAYSLNEYLAGVTECFIIGTHGQRADRRRLAHGWIRVVADKVVHRVRRAVVCLDMLRQRSRICELTGFGGVDASGTAITAATTREQYSRYGQAHRYNNAFWCTDKRSFGVRWS